MKARSSSLSRCGFSSSGRRSVTAHFIAQAIFTIQSWVSATTPRSNSLICACEHPTSRPTSAWVSPRCFRISRIRFGRFEFFNPSAKTGGDNMGMLRHLILRSGWCYIYSAAVQLSKNRGARGLERRFVERSTRFLSTFEQHRTA